MASPQPALRQSGAAHIHVASERCPVCDQPIPNEKADEVRARLKARDKRLADAARERLVAEFAVEKAQIEAANKDALERVRTEGAEALAKARGETAAQVAAARDEGRKEAEVAARERVAALEESIREREAEWQEKLEGSDRDRQGAIAQYERLKEEQDQILNRRVQEMREALEKDHADKQNERDAAHAAEKHALTAKVADLARQLEKKTADELGEGAEVKLFDELRAEFEADGDRVERVGRGNSGADILHTVIHNGRECGTIIYDSKNHTAWRNDFVSKLIQDQTAAKADHAVLCVRKFPADAKQLTVRDGVIVVNPARAIALAGIMRKHMIQVHALRLSKTERAKKMAALYDFITSERCTHLLARIDSHAQSLLDMQVKEIKAHENNWEKQGTHLRAIQKIKGKLESEIDAIIGADDGTDTAP